MFDRLVEASIYLRDGGMVMVPLLAVSLWMWALIFQKVRQVYACSRQENRYSCDPFDSGLSPAAPGDWQSEVVRNFYRQRTWDPSTDKKLLKNLVEHHSSMLEKHVKTILVLASTAPLLGLLGTVNGMIATFDAVSNFGTGNARALAGGISEALITTQSGLAVAIPGLLMGTFIRRRVEKCQARMERFGLLLVRQMDSAMGGADGENRQSGAPR